MGTFSARNQQKHVYCQRLHREDSPERLAIDPDVWYIGTRKLLHRQQATVLTREVDRFVHGGLSCHIGLA